MMLNLVFYNGPNGEGHRQIWFDIDLWELFLYLNISELTHAGDVFILPDGCTLYLLPGRK